MLDTTKATCVQESIQNSSYLQLVAVTKDKSSTDQLAGLLVAVPFARTERTTASTDALFCNTGSLVSLTWEVLPTIGLLLSSGVVPRGCVSRQANGNGQPASVPQPTEGETSASSKLQNCMYEQTLSPTSSVSPDTRLEPWCGGMGVQSGESAPFGSSVDWLIHRFSISYVRHRRLR